MYSRQQLTDGIRRLGVAPGDVVMLHASVRAVGPIAGGADQIHLALKDTLGADGTLLMYASCPDGYDDVGRHVLSAAQAAELLEKLPAFDARTARSARDNGALVELLRTYPGSAVNDHVNRCVAWGRQARHLLAAQPWNYSYGRGSVLERFHDLDASCSAAGSPWAPWRRRPGSRAGRARAWCAPGWRQAPGASSSSARWPPSL